MLSVRFEGDENEARDMIAVMRAAGIEVQVSTVKPRTETTHVYTIAQLAAAAVIPSDLPPLRVQATTGRPVRELPAVQDRRPRRR